MGGVLPWVTKRGEYSSEDVYRTSLYKGKQEGNRNK